MCEHEFEYEELDEHFDDEDYGYDPVSESAHEEF
jgi:hypothetical protein